MKAQSHNASEGWPGAGQGRRSGQCSSDSRWGTELRVPSSLFSLVPSSHRVSGPQRTRSPEVDMYQLLRHQDLEVRSSKPRRPDHPDSAPR